MVFKRYLQVEALLDGALDSLAAAISRFPILEHVRYYTLPPSYVKGSWRSGDNFLWDGPGWQVPNGTYDLSMRPDVQAGEGLVKLQRCFANGTLLTLTMPYYSNIGAFCALPWAYMTIDQTMFPASLRRVSVNLIIQRTTQPVFDAWIYRCPNLEYLEIAMCRAPGFDLEQLGPQQFWNFQPRDLLETPPTKLTEVRLLTDTSFYIDGDMLLMGLADFPALKRLALGHFMMRDRTWVDLFAGLLDVWRWKIELDALWLLNPMINSILPWNTPPEPPYRRYDNHDVARETAKGAAKEVRIIHLPFPWGEGPVVAGLGRGYDFPRFEVFERNGQ
jgi:hypothetical protein